MDIERKVIDEIAETIFVKDNAEEIKKLFSEFIDELVITKDNPLTSKFGDYLDFFNEFPVYYFAKKTFKDQNITGEEQTCCEDHPRIKLAINYKLTGIDYIKAAEGEILRDGKEFYFTKKFHVTPFNPPSIPEKLDVIPKVSKYLMANTDRSYAWADTIENANSLLITQLKMYMNVLSDTKLYIRMCACDIDDRIIGEEVFRGYLIICDWVLIK